MGSVSLQPGLSLSGRRFWVLAALLFLVSFGLRLATLQSVYHPDDSPETVLAGALGGIQHPPSYPLYTLLTRAAALILPGNPGYQAAVLAAGLASMAIVLLAALALRVLGTLPAAIQPSPWIRPLLTLAFILGSVTLPQLWFQGLSAKGGIYGLNLCLTLACLGSFGADREGLSLRWARLGTLLAGLGLADHYMSFVLFGPALLWWSWRSRPHFRHHVRLALWLLPGMSLYLYLPLRAVHRPFLNWGDPSTLSRFWDAILRSQYAAGESARAAGKTMELARYFFSLVPGELTWLGLGLGILGIGALVRGSWKPLLLCLGLHLALVLNYNNPPLPWVINAFFLPDFALLWMLAYIGSIAYAPRLAPLHPQAPLAGAALLLAGVIALTPGRYRGADLSHDFLLYDYDRDLQVNLAPQSALLAAGGNDAFGLWYLQGLEKRRNDVSVVDVPLIGAWYLDQLRLRLPELDPAWRTPNEVVQGLLGAPRRPLYYSSHNPGDRGIPLGLVSLVPPPGMNLPLSVDGLLGRFKALRLRWVADLATPMDGNRQELLEYYGLSAQALSDFGQRQHVVPLAQGGQRWADLLRGAAKSAENDGR